MEVQDGRGPWIRHLPATVLPDLGSRVVQRSGGMAEGGSHDRQPKLGEQPGRVHGARRLDVRLSYQVTKDMIQDPM